MEIRVPRLSYEDVRGYADRFLAEHHHLGSIPIPIEQIVEFGLGISIVPIPNLLAVHDVDGFLSADGTEITVDQFILEHRQARYRFTLAHEAAHLILHGDVLKDARPASIPEWKRFVRELAESDREWLEWQAYAFAGLVLVPRRPLDVTYHEAVAFATAAGLDLDASFDIAKNYVSSAIARSFEVSPPVIEKRLRYDGIWPR